MEPASRQEKTTPVTLYVNGAALTLVPGDCIAGMERDLAPESIDVVVTSPPYNLGVKYATYADNAPRRDYLAWLDEWAAAVRRVLSPRGSLFLNVGSKPSDPWVPFEVAGVMRRHFVLQNVLHWIKAISIDKADVGNYPGLTEDVSVGHYKPIRSPRFVNDNHEYILHLTRHGDVPLDRLAVGVPYRDKSNVRRWAAAKQDRHCRGNTWFIPYETIQRASDERPHPASFPVALPERCILLHGLTRTRRVLDPFLGIGPTALACARLGVDFVGYELDPAYFAESVRRVQATLDHPPPPPPARRRESGPPALQ